MLVKVGVATYDLLHMRAESKSQRLRFTQLFYEWNDL